VQDDDTLSNLGNSELKILLSDVNPSFPQRIHPGLGAYTLQ